MGKLVRPRLGSPLFLGLHAFFAFLTISVLVAVATTESLDDAMAFYGMYHRNGWNQLIHFFGIPAILWTMILLGAHVPWTTKLLIQWPTPHYFSWATFLYVFYTTYYIWIDPIGGIGLMLPILTGFYYTSVTWTAQEQNQYKDPPIVGPKLTRFIVAVQLLSWYLQIHPGHAVLEGSKPALLDSLGASFSTAPLFGVYEGVWFLGLRTELRDRVREKIALAITEACARGATMRACG